MVWIKGKKHSAKTKKKISKSRTLSPEDRQLRDGSMWVEESIYERDEKWLENNSRFSGPDCTDCQYDIPKSELCSKDIFRYLNGNIYRTPKKGCKQIAFLK